MKKPFGILVQYLCPQHALSRFAGWMANNRWPWLKNYLIRDFIKRYSVDLRLATRESVEDYINFNDFFTRHLKPELRPFVQEKNELGCPVDGRVSQLGKIDRERLFQAKGFQYDLTSLLGGDKEQALPYHDGSFATLYLAPQDYHRVHMPFAGTLKETIYIPGDLFSVNNQTTHHVPRLFSRNERLVCFFDTEIGPMAVILVGAMIVGSINTVWPQHPINRKKISKQSFTDNPIYLERGQELGHFKLGSTVIILFGQDKVEWTPLLKADTDVKFGQLLGLTKR